MKSGFSVRRWFGRGNTRAVVFLPKAECLESRELLTLTLTQINPIAGEPVGGLMATFLTSDLPNAPTKATIWWGDGNSTQSTPVKDASNASQYDIFGINTYSARGSYPLAVTISDGTNQLSESETVTVTSNPLGVTAIPQTTFPGIPISGTVAYFQTSDTSATSSSYAATIDWGDGQKSAGTITGSFGQFTITGNNTYNTVGTYPINVSVTQLSTAATSSGTSIANVQSYQIHSSGNSVTAFTGQPISANVASFSVNDPAAVPNDFTATINWGNGDTSPGVINAAGGSPGQFTVASNNYSYAAPNNYNISVSINWIKGNTGTNARGSASVTSYSLIPSPTPANAMVGSALSATIANFTTNDPNASNSDFIATIDWGNGQILAGTIYPVYGAPGQFTVFGTTTYSSPGLFSPLVTIIRTANQQSYQVTSTVNVLEAPYGVAGSALIAVAGVSIPNGTVVATFTTTDGSVNASSFTASIEWSPGQSTPGVIVPTGTYGQFQVQLPSQGVTYQYGKPGSYPVNVTIVRSDNGQSVVATAHLTVLAPVNTAGVQAVVNPLTANLYTLGNGPAAAHGITNNNQPLFTGNAVPGATVRIFVQRFGQLTPTLAGETIAGPDGVWQTSLGLLADGTYSVTGVQIPPGGPATLPAAFSNLVIDTTRPRLLGATPGLSSREYLVTFQSGPAGIAASSLTSPGSYQLVGRNGAVISAISAIPVATNSSNGIQTETVRVSFAGRSRQFPPGPYTIRLTAGSVHDLAGNEIGTSSVMIKAGRTGVRHPAQRRK